MKSPVLLNCQRRVFVVEPLGGLALVRVNRLKPRLQASTTSLNIVYGKPEKVVGLVVARPIRLPPDQLSVDYHGFQAGLG